MFQPCTDRLSTRGTNSAPRILLSTAAIALALLAGVTRSDAAIYLNEITTQPVTLTRAELYNSGPATVTLTGWKIFGSRGEFTIQSQITLPPGSRTVISSLGDIFDPIGGLAGIIDDLGRQGDRVRYGTVGGAPAAPGSSMLGAVSLARTPDASNVPAPPISPALDGRFWTIDLSPTFGAPNDIPNPNLGRDVCINEMMTNPTPSLPDSIEICGPAMFTGGNVNLNGWYVSTAYGVQFLSGLVPSSGLLGIGIETRLSLDNAYRIDLYDPNGVRVYQKSTYNAPEPRSTCYGDCPDHAAPPDGWDYLTCGGGVTFFPLKCSIGYPNAPGGVCVVQEDPDGGGAGSDGTGPKGRETAPQIRRGSWGKIKSISREGLPRTSKH